jgi:uncharacterized protein
MRKAPVLALSQSPTELDAFADTVDRLAGFSDRLGVEWADGYLTALATGPRARSIDEWLPKMCGDAFERCFADPEDAQTARVALQRRAKWLMRQLDPERLLDHPEAMHLAPLIYEHDEALVEAVRAEAQGDPQAALPTPPSTGEEWSRGFFEAIEDFGEDWPYVGNTFNDDDSHHFDKLLAVVAAMGRPEDSTAYAQFMAVAFGDAKFTRDELISEACFAVQDLRVWWLDHGPANATVYSEPKPGRNEPCPCGSGKKYKKCHGLS